MKPVLHTPRCSRPRWAQGGVSSENLSDTPYFDPLIYLCKKHFLKWPHLVAKLWDFFFLLTRQPAFPKNVFVLVGGKFLKICHKTFRALNIYNMTGTVGPETQ